MKIILNNLPAKGLSGYKKRARRTSAVQYEKLISFMEKHTELGLFKLSGPNAKQEGAQLWETLKNELNCEVDPEKSVH